jgi:DNA repair ATPase RecN
VIDRLNAEINQEQAATGNVEEETAKLKKLAGEAVKLSEAKTTATEDKFYLDLQALMLKDTGIKANVIKQYIPIMNKLINKYLSGLDFFASFNLNENFEEVIKSRNRDELQYESFSEGEKLKIDLSILFTWITIAKMKNTVATNLLIFDEVTDAGLDTDSSSLIVGILKELAKNAHVFVISHHPELYADKFERHLKFQKVNNYSMLVD